MGYKIFFVFTASLLFMSCDLDPFLFNNEKLDRYTLSNKIIPDSLRHEVTFKSEGNTLYGYFVKSNLQTFEANYTIFYFHGNKHNIEEYWDRVEFFYQAGFNVFIFDYRGFGRSEGKSDEASLYADARAARDILIANSRVDTSKIVVYGYSLGCVPAIEISSKYPPNKLILEAPFASGEALVQSGTLLEIPGGFVLKGEFNNKEKIKSVHVPVAIIAGTADKFIDINKNSAVIYNNANSPKYFLKITGADHTNVPQTMGLIEYNNFLFNAISWSFR